MISTLKIRNFKSIKQVSIACKRINILIGEPNTGKSNILEALGILSYLCYYRSDVTLRNFVRYEVTRNLFYDEDIGEEIEIAFDDQALRIGFRGGSFRGDFLQGQLERPGVLLGSYGDIYVGGDVSSNPISRLSPFKFYRFTAVKSNFRRPDSEFLLPPSGENLPTLLLAHRELKAIAEQIFDPFGLHLVLRPHENTIEVTRQSKGVFIFYPYSLTSDTLQRLIFYLFAVITNKDSVITFEEPEAHAFPYYTKYLAEKIALDGGSNQYFVTTHNPYFLFSILEKAHKDEVGIFITYLDDYQTKVKCLNEEEKGELMGMESDAFFNIDRFLDER
jgi:predicted ATPase